MQLRKLDDSQLLDALRPGTAVFPTLYKWPATSWRALCNIGLTSASGKVGAIVNFNNRYGVVAVAWQSATESDAAVIGLYRYNMDAFDVCFSGK